MAKHVYIHVPFCARRCSYCDFAIAVRRDVPVARYLDALRAEIATRFGFAKQGTVDTIYFGGGTPSHLGAEGVSDAVALVASVFSPTRDAEITIEANPEDVTVDAARVWRQAGVNRVSLGAQTFNEPALEWMHRGHGAEGILRAVDALRQGGITNISLDLIFALPDRLARNWQYDLERVLALAPDHVSLYGLTIEPMTPLGRWVARGRELAPGEEPYEAEYMLAHDMLVERGFDHYEVSNYGRPGRWSRHNAAYWAHVPYVGLGPSAHGYDGNVRRWNLRHFQEWSDVALGGRDPIEGSETLTSANRVAEDVYLGLRSTVGLHITDADRPAVEPWMAAGWITLDAMGTARCTPSGWLRLDAIAAALTNHRSR